MEKYITWYRLLIKSWMKRKSSWLQLAGLLLVVALVGQVKIPDINNTVIGLCNEDGAFVQEVIESLQTGESVFQFQVYSDSEEMQQAVIRGELEGGFIFEKGLEKDLQKGKRKKLITVITTPLTTKGAVAKETVFAAFFERYSQDILLEQEETVFGREDAEVSEALLKKNQEYLKSDEIFRLDFEEVAGKGTEAATGADTFPVRGMAALLIFVMILLEHGKKFEQKDCVFEKALTQREKMAFELLRYVSTATIPALASAGLIMITGNGVFFLKEILGMVIFILVCAIWVFLIGKLFRNGTTYASWIMTLVIGNLLLCPVFLNISQYVPALGYIGCIFPVGMYLRLF